MKRSQIENKFKWNIQDIFVSQDVEVTSADIPAIVASDHRPHTASLELGRAFRHSLKNERWHFIRCCNASSEILVLRLKSHLPPPGKATRESARLNKAEQRKFVLTKNETV